MDRRSSEGHAQDAAEGGQDAAHAWTEGYKMPQTPRRRGTRCRRCLDGGSVSAPNRESHYTGSAHLATQWTRFKIPPPTHGRRVARSAGATKSTYCGGGARSGPRGVREIYAAFLNGSQLGYDPAIWRRLYKRIETEYTICLSIYVYF